MEQGKQETLQNKATAPGHLLGNIPEYWWKPKATLIWPAKQYFAYTLYTDLRPVEVLDALRPHCKDFTLPENAKTNKEGTIELSNIRATDPHNGVRLNLTIKKSNIEGGVTVEGYLKHPFYLPAWGVMVATAIPFGSTVILVFLTFLAADKWLSKVSTMERERFKDATDKVKQGLPPERIVAQDRAEAHAQVVNAASSRQPAQTKAFYSELLASQPHFVVKYNGGIPVYNQCGKKITMVVAPYGIHFFYKKTTEFVVPWKSLINVAVKDEKEKEPSAMRDVATATAIGTFANRRASAIEQIAAGTFLGMFAGDENVTINKQLSIQYKVSEAEDFVNEIMLETSENSAIKQKVLEHQHQEYTGNL